MLGQYKKIAIIETLVQKIDRPSQRSLTIPLNLEFTPKRILAYASTTSIRVGEHTFADSKHKTHIELRVYIGSSYKSTFIEVESFDKNNLVFSLGGSDAATFSGITFEIIAIE